MLNLKCKIEIEIKRKDTTKIVSFDYVNSIEIKTSRSNLTDTATIKVSGKMHRKGESLESLLKKEDKVTIQIGYEEYGLQPVFTGYLTGIKNDDTILELSCENEMYWLKTDYMVNPGKIEDIKKFFQRNLWDKKYKTCGEIFFYGINIERKMKMSQVLDLIKKKYPYLKFYFKEGVFCAVEEGTPDTDKEAIIFDPSRNMISNKLKYEKSESKKNCVRAISMLDNLDVLLAYTPEKGWEDLPFRRNDNAGFQVYAPEYTDSEDYKMSVVAKGYTEERLECHECKTQEDLQKYVEKIAENKNAARISGSFIAFGIPFVRKGDIVKLQDKGKEWNNKQFIVEEVEYKFGVPPAKGGGGSGGGDTGSAGGGGASGGSTGGGYRQTITLGREIK